MKFRKSTDNSNDESRVSRLKKGLRREKDAENQTNTRVTNSNLEHHRQEVISRGRRFKYPFYHSRHRVVTISSFVLLVAVVLFFVFSITKLYRYQAYDDFSYALTEIIPFPVAKVDGHSVSYRQYLFELRLFTFNTSHDPNVDFSTTDGKRMLATYERQALTSAETYTYARSVAAEKGITVSKNEVNQNLELIKQHSLSSVSGPNKSVDRSIFDRTIKEKYDWSETDLRSWIQELLYKEKVAAAQDTIAAPKASEVLNKLSKKQSFSSLAKKYSDDDNTKASGGVVGLVSRDGSQKSGDVTTKTNLPDVVLKTLFSLQAGQTSGVVKAPDALYIIKNLKNQDGQRQLALIQISYKPLTQYINDLRQQGKIKEYISLPKVDITPQNNQ